MYRVLIVDDEAYVVDWLSTTLESRTVPELDVCRAYSAEEALAWLGRAKIDIIISDIQMSGMNGIALAEKVKLNWPHCKVIFLTAYAKFDYAYDAIRNNVIGYVLKTEDDARIFSEVDKAVEMIDKETKNLQILERAQDQLNDSSSVVKKEILMSILKKEYENPQILFRQLKNIGSPLSFEKPSLMVMARIEDGLSEKDILARSRQISSIHKIIGQYLAEYFYLEHVEFAFNKFVYLLQIKDCGASIAGHESVFVAGMLETVQQSCKNALDLCISFVLHGLYLDAEQLPECFQTINRLMKLHTVEQGGFIITDTTSVLPTADKSVYAERHEVPDIARKLRMGLEDNKQNIYMTEIERAAEMLYRCASWHDPVAWEIYYAVASVMISYLNQRQLTEKIAFQIDLNVLFHPQYAETWPDVADYLKKLSGILFELQQSTVQESSNNIVRFLKNYIEGHITQDISLIKLSEVSGYNATYLSKVFKKDTGETINNYISGKKLEKIRELMSDENLNISEIALKAGFEYRTYFNRFVKKFTGMSPQEYRSSQRMGKDSIQKLK